MRYLAADFGPAGIRVNAISAGPIRTLAGAGIADARFMFNFQREHSPLRRTVTIEDVGGAALYLLSGLVRGRDRRNSFRRCGLQYHFDAAAGRHQDLGVTAKPSDRLPNSERRARLGLVLAGAGLGEFRWVPRTREQGQDRSSRRRPQAVAFAKFIESLRPQAEAEGVSRKTFDEAFRGVTFNARVVAFTVAQPEFAKPIWQYLASAVSASRIETRPGEAGGRTILAPQGLSGVRRRRIRHHGHMGHGDRVRRLRRLGKCHSGAGEPRLRSFSRRLFPGRTDVRAVDP